MLYLHCVTQSATACVITTALFFCFHCSIPLFLYFETTAICVWAFSIVCLFDFLSLSLSLTSANFWNCIQLKNGLWPPNNKHVHSFSILKSIECVILSNTKFLLILPMQKYACQIRDENHPNNGRCSRSENPVFAWKRFSDKQFSFRISSFHMKMKRKSEQKFHWEKWDVSHWHLIVNKNFVLRRESVCVCVPMEPCIETSST